MIDFTSEDGIMDAIDKFFHLSQEEKDNYNKSLKVDKANTLRFLYMFHEVFKLRDFEFKVENEVDEPNSIMSTTSKATITKKSPMVFEGDALTYLAKVLKFADEAIINFDEMNEEIYFPVFVKGTKVRKGSAVRNPSYYDAKVFNDDRSIFYDLREKAKAFYPDKDYDEQKLFAVANFIKMFNYDLNDNMLEGFVKVSITKGLVLNGKFDSWIISTPRRIEVFRQLLEYSESFKIEACEDNDCRFEFEIKELM